MCGVIGIIGPSVLEDNPSWAAFEAYRGLLTLQHRGQDAAGILSYNPSFQKFHQEKDLGLIASVFDQDSLMKLKGSMALGHTRYATAGGDGKEDLQPLVTGFPFGVGMVHNGNVVNYHSVTRELQSNHQLKMLTNNDLELFLHLWCQKLSESNGEQSFKFDPEKALKACDQIFETLEGGYAVVGIMADEGLFGMRDPHGIRPLVLGRKKFGTEGDKYSYCLCSETISLNFLGYEIVRDIEPGEFIFIKENGEIFSSISKAAKGKEKAPCMFEWIYFSGAESQFENVSVYNARLNLGKVLAKKARHLIQTGEINPDVVCPVPDTSRTASISLAENLGLPYRESLIKNRYIQRSFILNTQEKREKAVELKLSPVRSEIEAKKILLVDDSIVRGTTSKKIIDLLKRHGASDITLAITCPPLRYACYYGIDFPNPKELIAKDKTLEEIADWVGANKVIYLDESDLVEAIEKEKMCMACVNNKYPTSVTEAEEFSRLRDMHKDTLS